MNYDDIVFIIAILTIFNFLFYFKCLNLSKIKSFICALNLSCLVLLIQIAIDLPLVLFIAVVAAYVWFSTVLIDKID